MYVQRCSNLLCAPLQHRPLISHSATCITHVQVLSAGADGLVKLWGVRTSECLATFDEHEAKVWAMHVGGAGDSLLVTGGADARVNVWRDCTAEDEASAAAERTEAALRGQELSNALQVRPTFFKYALMQRKGCQMQLYAVEVLRWWYCLSGVPGPSLAILLWRKQQNITEL